MNRPRLQSPERILLVGVKRDEANGEAVFVVKVAQHGIIWPLCRVNLFLFRCNLFFKLIQHVFCKVDLALVSAGSGGFRSSFLAVFPVSVKG